MLTSAILLRERLSGRGIRDPNAVMLKVQASGRRGYIGALSGNRACGESASCSTISGPDPSSACSFPFIFEGISWTGCTIADEPAENPQPWCVTQTNENGYPVPLPSDGNNVFST